MLRSLFSGISGLRAHQTMLDVTSNNIANVNTAGFKSSATVFADTLSQTLKNATSPAGGRAGINPVQVGLGVQVAGITTNFSQGSAQTTGRSTDMLIQGDGFFVINNGSEDLYTRAGSFTFDADGRLTNNEGSLVQGWQGVKGVVDTNAPISGISIPTGTLVEPVPSTFVTLGGNIGVTNQPGDTNTLTATVFDSQGVGHSITATLTLDTTGKTYAVTLAENVPVTTPPTAQPTTTAGSITFDASGKPTATPTPAKVTFADGTVVNFNLDTLLQYGGTKTLGVKDQDGTSAATLEAFEVSQTGVITGVFSNGSKEALGQVAIADFNNPAGLEKLGNTSFRNTTNSGTAQIGVANFGGRGGILNNNIEMSNVDLGQEFTNLIIAQRGFQANSKIIQTSDDVLNDLVNIKR